VHEDDVRRLHGGVGGEVAVATLPGGAQQPLTSALGDARLERGTKSVSDRFELDPV
jgi:predicted ThiF/HesA family dinucleotide-utilizing enzyme